MLVLRGLAQLQISVMAAWLVTLWDCSRFSWSSLLLNALARFLLISDHSMTTPGAVCPAEDCQHF